MLCVPDTGETVIPVLRKCLYVVSVCVMPHPVDVRITTLPSSSLRQRLNYVDVGFFEFVTP
jgi:hypothetical protein